MDTHSMPQSLKYHLIFITAIIFTILMATAYPVRAFWSGEKTPQEKAAEIEKKATKKYNNGVKHMKKAHEKAEKGDSSYAFNYRATADAKARKEYEKAVKDFNKAIEKLPDMKEAHNNLGYCYRKLDKLDLSLAAYEKAIALDSAFAQAREYRGETFLALDSLAGAMAEMEYLKQLNSAYADTLSRSIKLYRLNMFNKRIEEMDSVERR